MIIIRNKGKQKYYDAFREYDFGGKTKRMEKIMTLALIESLHKRITYLKGDKIITVSEYSKKNNKNLSNLLNSAKRQTIPAFRERGGWRISEKFK